MAATIVAARDGRHGRTVAVLGTTGVGRGVYAAGGIDDGLVAAAMAAISA